MTPKTLNEWNSTLTQVTINFKIHQCHNKHEDNKYILLSNFFCDFLVNNCRKPSVFGTVFVHFGQIGGLFASFSSLHSHSLPWHSPCQQSTYQAD